MLLFCSYPWIFLIAVDENIERWENGDAPSDQSNLLPIRKETGK